MKNKVLLLLLFCAGIPIITAQEKVNPSFDQVISLQSVSNPEISPDGQHLVFQKTAADWKNNRYDTEIWISLDGKDPFQLTRTEEGSSNDPKWSPDGKWVAFRAKRGEKTQIQAIRIAGGEARPVTEVKGNITGFEWSPDGRSLAFTMAEDNSQEEKQRKERYGAFAVEDEEYQQNQLWVQDFTPQEELAYPLPEQLQDSSHMAAREARALIKSEDFNIGNFKWSPDGRQIAFQHQPDPLINSFFKADISVYDFATNSHQKLVSNASFDGLIDWSPDGQSILYQSSLNDTTSNYYLNGNLFRIGRDGSNNRQLAADFDEDLSRLSWNASGIYALAWQKTRRVFLHIDPRSGKARILPHDLERIYDYSFSDDGKTVAYTGANDEQLTEIYKDAYPPDSRKKLTRSSAQIQNWQVAASEVISWKSQDGATIEGVLHMPQDYDPAKKYPLLVIIHGGPTGISTPGPVPSYVYPMVQWLNKGALILRPNYRGSAGYGEKFRSLNVKNLGVGDAWDVLSGVDHLAREGRIDPDRVGAMGWSQGGYISAFLTTNSQAFKAISVGAGISNWMTYYVNTDIHPFTRQYLKATPWSDKAIYEKTSPMTNINQASTPTLIQHGEFDKRVPVANAYELFQGLQDVGVPTKLIIYKGFGHGINKPKERLAATWHNWQWFAKYIWEEVVEVPLK